MINKFTSIDMIILGLLNQQPQSGYDLKKIITNESIYFWSGNNNQIYTSLIKLHQQNLVTCAVDNRSDRIPRKIYTITKAGKAELKQWLLATPILPVFKDMFLLRYYFGDELNLSEKQTIVDQYEQEIITKYIMLKEEKKRGKKNSKWQEVMDHVISMYATEMKWIKQLQVIGK